MPNSDLSGSGLFWGTDHDYLHGHWNSGDVPREEGTHDLGDGAEEESYQVVLDFDYLLPSDLLLHSRPGCVLVFLYS